MTRTLFSKSTLKTFALIFGIWTALGLLWAFNAYHLRIAIGARAPMRFILERSLGEHWVWAALTPIVLWFATAFPFERGRILKTIGIHLAFFVVLSVIHVTISEALHIPMAYGTKPLPGSTWLMRFNLEFYPDLWNYAPLVFLANLISYYRKFRERELRNSQLETKLARTQLEALRAQLQPHFLFNTLNSISSLMHENVEAADDMLADLSLMLRGSLNSSDTQLIPLRQELELLEAYLRIQRRRFEDRLHTRVEAKPDTLDAQVPTLLLQPLVENAIQHGIAPLARSGTVEVLTRRESDRLIVEVIDNGCGLKEDHKERIGLTNTRQRLSQLYGARQEFELVSQDGEGVRVKIAIPFETVSEREGADADTDAGSGRRTVSAPSHSVAVEG